MEPTPALASIATLAVLLALASATAGALWWRARTSPTFRAEALARELAGRLREAEAVLARVESRAAGAAATGAGRPARTSPFPAGPASSRRPDPPAVSAASGPTLIAVPDLAAASAEAEDAAAELAGRYGPIWDLADSGAPPEAIARATGHPIGQVELILGLRRRLAHNGPGDRA